MATQINITIGDQRLLQNVKTRAAANQQALDDRQQKAKTEDTATKAVEREEEDRNGVPEPKVVRRPAANRRKKEEFGFVGIDLSDFRTTGAPLTRTAVWTRYNLTQTNPITIGEFTETNSYDIRTKTLDPFFVKSTQTTPTQQESKLCTGFDPYTRALSIQTLTWTFRSAYIFKSSASGDLSRYSTIPAFDLNPAVLNVVSRPEAVVSCTPTHVYYAARVSVDETSQNVIDACNDPNFYTFTNTYGTFVVGPSLNGPKSFTLGTGANFLEEKFTYTPSSGLAPLTITGFNRYALGIYAKCDIEKGTVESRIVGLTDLVAADPDFDPAGQSAQGVAFYFYSNMDVDNPHYSLFQTAVNTFGKNNSLSYAAFLWPSGLNYDIETGNALFLADFEPDVTDKKALMKATFAAGTSYGTVRASFNGAQFFSRAFLEEKGFTFVQDIDVASPYSAAYDTTCPFGKLL